MAGQGITEAVTDVLRRELERERRKPRRDDKEKFHRDIEEIVQELQAASSSGRRPQDDEILGYNEQGLFD